MLLLFNSAKAAGDLLRSCCCLELPPANGPIDQKQTNLSWLGSMYAMYISQNQGHPPKTIDELRKYVEKTNECGEAGAAERC